ncbi:MAG: hypothetical protein ABIH71_05890, partial [Candidatus Omnitrophota bacterium]
SIHHEFIPDSVIEVSKLGAKYNVGIARVEETAVFFSAFSTDAYPFNNLGALAYVSVEGGIGDAWRDKYEVTHSEPSMLYLSDKKPFILQEDKNSWSGVCQGRFFTTGTQTYFTEGTPFIEGRRQREIQQFAIQERAYTSTMQEYLYIGKYINGTDKEYKFIGAKGRAYEEGAEDSVMQEYTTYVVVPDNKEKQEYMLPIGGDFFIPESAVGKLQLTTVLSNDKKAKAVLKTTDFHAQDTLRRSYFTAKVNSKDGEGIISSSLLNEKKIYFGGSENQSRNPGINITDDHTKAKVGSINNEFAVYTDGVLKIDFPLEGFAYVDWQSAEFEILEGKKLFGQKREIYKADNIEVKYTTYLEYEGKELKCNVLGRMDDEYMVNIKHSDPVIEVLTEGVSPSVEQKLNKDNIEIVGKTSDGDLVGKRVYKASWDSGNKEMNGYYVFGKGGHREVVTPDCKYTCAGFAGIDGRYYKFGMGWNEPYSPRLISEEKFFSKYFFYDPVEAVTYNVRYLFNLGMSSYARYREKLDMNPWVLKIAADNSHIDPTNDALMERWFFTNAVLFNGGYKDSGFDPVKKWVDDLDAAQTKIKGFNNTAVSAIDNAATEYIDIKNNPPLELNRPLSNAGRSYVSSRIKIFIGKSMIETAKAGAMVICPKIALVGAGIGLGISVFYDKLWKKDKDFGVIDVAEKMYNYAGGIALTAVCFSAGNYAIGAFTGQTFSAYVINHWVTTLVIPTVGYPSVGAVVHKLATGRSLSAGQLVVLAGLGLLTGAGILTGVYFPTYGAISEASVPAVITEKLGLLGAQAIFASSLTHAVGYGLVSLGVANAGAIAIHGQALDWQYSTAIFAMVTSMNFFANYLTSKIMGSLDTASKAGNIPTTHNTVKSTGSASIVPVGEASVAESSAVEAAREVGRAYYSKLFTKALWQAAYGAVEFGYLGGSLGLVGNAMLSRHGVREVENSLTKEKEKKVIEYNGVTGLGIAAWDVTKTWFSYAWLPALLGAGFGVSGALASDTVFVKSGWAYKYFSPQSG